MENPADPFNKEIFIWEKEKVLFKELILWLDWTQPIFISRNEFNQRKWDILRENTKWTYSLYLARDVKIYELPWIIKKINSLTYWSWEIPKYASSKELKVKILKAISFLSELLEQNKVNNQKIKKSIRKYIQIYADLYPNDNLQDIASVQGRELLIQEVYLEKHKTFEEKLLKLKTKQELEQIRLSLDTSLQMKLKTIF